MKLSFFLFTVAFCAVSARSLRAHVADKLLSSATQLECNAPQKNTKSTCEGKRCVWVSGKCQARGSAIPSGMPGVPGGGSVPGGMPGGGSVPGGMPGAPGGSVPGMPGGGQASGGMPGGMGGMGRCKGNFPKCCPDPTKKPKCQSPEACKQQAQQDAREKELAKQQKLRQAAQKKQQCDDYYASYEKALASLGNGPGPIPAAANPFAGGNFKIPTGMPGMNIPGMPGGGQASGGNPAIMQKCSMLPSPPRDKGGFMCKKKPKGYLKECENVFKKPKCPSKAQCKQQAEQDAAEKERNAQQKLRQLNQQKQQCNDWRSQIKKLSKSKTANCMEVPSEPRNNEGKVMCGGMQTAL